ncbi:MFS transporter [Halobacillus litoralis]|uniref:MFS transporter n=1 Tax=Halobacillus litoralis TaxID=45668 RepID=UPI001CFDB27B|nr:MFS transporter [Halobacillus litoralis]
MAVRDGAVQRLENELGEQSSLFKNKNFLLLWGAALLSSFGISFFLFSESWYVVNVLGLEASLGILYIASSIPRLLFMMISGTVADRYSKTKIMFLSDFIRGLLLVGLVVWFFLGGITLWTFVLFAFLFGILDAFFWAAESAVIPSIIDKEQLTRGNSIIQMTNQASFILAPMIAAAIIAFGNYQIVFITTAVMLVIASLLIFLMRTPAKVDNSKGQEKFWDTFKEGLVYVKGSRVITLIIATTIFINLFIVGPMTMGLPLFVKKQLEGSALDFSFLESGMAVGMLIGSVVVGVLNIKHNRGRVSLLSLIFGGVSFVALSFTTELWLSIVCLSLFGISLSMCNIPFIAALQSLVEEEMLGRVMGLVSLASMGLIPVSFAITSAVLAMGVSIHHIMAIGASLLTLYSMFAFMRFKELRELD